MGKHNSGLTLVEVVVGASIVGIMAAVAVPQYQRYQTLARQTEAKSNLSNIYTAEASFVVESSTYTSCLTGIGFNRRGQKRFYGIGFGANSGWSDPNCGPDGTVNCNYYTFSSLGTGVSACTAVENQAAYDATTKVNLSAVIVSLATMGTSSSISKSSFTAEALGNVTNDTLYDSWIIDQNKTLFNKSQTGS